ncbi:alpha-galactosidase [Butyrivibrio fibrisolvens]|uniref:Alpha-galactosidase n=1 Tax=Butyrivibrio fibrisolvens TaxID=831 RepID=A0A1H9TKQ2_BUTFI|nr:glycoside hydrolase family 36 protein [Butyrivibrio fibrisolvens]SER97785.1 alpha-galactosidase [Butyrivibrio fibrisolvens]
MEEVYAFQVKVRGDSFNGHYTNGISLANSESVRRCREVYKDDEKTAYEADNYKVTAYHIPKGDVTQCYTVFENTSSKDITIDLLSSFCIDNIEADVLHRATSFWSAEGKLLTQKLTDLNMEPSWNKHGTRIEKFGQIGSMPVRKWFPYAVLENTATGEFIGVQIYCASSWQIEVFRTADPVSLCGGLADFDYGHWCKCIRSGESFTTPRAVVAKGKSLLEVSDKLVKAQNPRIADADKDMPIIYNEYCTTWGNPTLDNVKKICEALKDTKVRYLVIDSGWYKQPDKFWWDTIGDWDESPELFPNGIKEMTDMIKSYGLIPGIWFEFEKAATLSQLYEQTEHLLKRFGDPINVDGQRFLDMRDDWCIDYLSKKVIDFLKKNGFGYIKIDYNDTIGVGCDGAESLGEGLRQSVLGTQKFFKKLSDEIPSLVIENCSSGGHRLEPSMMELVSQASFSDAHECKSIPVIAANLHRVIRPEQSQIWAVLRAADDIHRVNYILSSAFLGRMCLSGEIFDIDQRAWDTTHKAIDFYDEVKHIIKNGMTTVIDCKCNDYNNLTGYQAVIREYEDEALLVVHTFENGSNPDIDQYLSGYNIIDTFGSELDGDFRGKAFFLRR